MLIISSRDEVEGLIGSFLAERKCAMLRTKSKVRTVSLFCRSGRVTLVVLSMVVPGVSN